MVLTGLTCTASTGNQIDLLGNGTLLWPQGYLISQWLNFGSDAFTKQNHMNHHDNHIVVHQSADSPRTPCEQHVQITNCKEPLNMIWKAC